LSSALISSSKVPAPSPSPSPEFHPLDLSEQDERALDDEELPMRPPSPEFPSLTTQELGELEEEDEYYSDTSSANQQSLSRNSLTQDTLAAEIQNEQEGSTTTVQQQTDYDGDDAMPIADPATQQSEPNPSVTEYMEAQATYTTQLAPDNNTPNPKSGGSSRSNLVATSKVTKVITPQPTGPRVSRRLQGLEPVGAGDGKEKKNAESKCV
jgi:hypothetical protein